MLTYIAFLRAINVGGHTVKMDRLRGLFAEMGFANVETFIASGNVIFESDSDDPTALEQQIEGALHRALGYEVATFLRTPAEVAAVAIHPAFPPAEMEAEGHSLYIGFLSAPPAPAATDALLACATEIDSFHLHGREVYWLCRTASHLSKFSGARLEKLLAGPATLRNVTTVKRLAAKYPPATD